MGLYDEKQSTVPRFQPFAFAPMTAPTYGMPSGLPTSKPKRSRTMAADAAMGSKAMPAPGINERGGVVRFMDPPKAPPAPTNASPPINTDPYLFGGDGAVAREAPAPKQSVNIGGVPREELIRRMEHAGMTMRGSPTARAAMMGMYADSVKAMDAGELQKNQGNIESDQQLYRGNMAANMQQAQGKQEFGNAMGLLNRRATLEAQAAAASADPEMRALKMRDLESQIAERGVLTAGKADAADAADAQATWKIVDAQLGPTATPEQRQAAYDDLRRTSGKKNADTDAVRIRRDADVLNTAANRPSNWGGSFEAAISADPDADVNLFTATGGNFPEGVTPADLKFTQENKGFWNKATRLSEPSNWNKTPDVTVNFGKGLSRRFKPDDPELKTLQSMQAAENARLKRYGEAPTK